MRFAAEKPSDLHKAKSDCTTNRSRASRFLYYVQRDVQCRTREIMSLPKYKDHLANKMHDRCDEYSLSFREERHVQCASRSIQCRDIRKIERKRERKRESERGGGGEKKWDTRPASLFFVFRRVTATAHDRRSYLSSLSRCARASTNRRSLLIVP